MITSVGASQSTVWYHDEHGDRPVSIEGFAYRPLVSPDDREVFYLVKRAARRSFSIGELWATDLASGRNRRLVARVPDQLVSLLFGRQADRVRFDSTDPTIRVCGLRRSMAAGAARRLTPNGDVEEQRPFFGASSEDLLHAATTRWSLRSLSNAAGWLGPPEVSRWHWFPRQHIARRTVGGPLEFSSTRLIPPAGGPSHGLCPCGIGPINPGPPGVSWSRDGETMFVMSVTGRSRFSSPNGLEGLPSSLPSKADRPEDPRRAQDSGVGCRPRADCSKICIFPRNRAKQHISDSPSVTAQAANITCLLRDWSRGDSDCPRQAPAGRICRASARSAAGAAPRANRSHAPADSSC